MEETFCFRCRTGFINPVLLLIHFETISLTAMGMNCSLLTLDILERAFIELSVKSLWSKRWFRFLAFLSTFFTL